MASVAVVVVFAIDAAPFYLGVAGRSAIAQAES
jgi:hypothetical protein